MCSYDAPASYECTFIAYRLDIGHHHSPTKMAAGALSSSADQRPANDGSHARSEKDHAPPSAATFSPSGSGRGIEELRRRLEALKAEQPMKEEYAAGPLL